MVKKKKAHRSPLASEKLVRWGRERTCLCVVERRGGERVFVVVAIVSRSRKKKKTAVEMSGMSQRESDRNRKIITRTASGWREVWGGKEMGGKGLFLSLFAMGRHQRRYTPQCTGKKGK